MHRRVRAFVVAFAHRYEHRPDDNQCQIRSRELVDEITTWMSEEQRPKLHLVWLREQGLDDAEQHMMTLIGGHVSAEGCILHGEVVDLAPRQYDVSAELPTIYPSIEDVPIRWVSYRLDEHDDDDEHPWGRVR